jgi:hypothetical protein
MSLNGQLGSLVGVFFVVGASVIACSGASGSDVFGSSGAATNDGGPGSSGSSGGTSGGGGTSSGGTSGGGTSGGSGCAGQKCDPPPGPNCTALGVCGCQPYRCDPVTEACVWSKTSNSCGAGRYCKTDSCGQGVCAPVAAVEQQERAPVCGCDGVTYWNISVANRIGTSIKSSGECGNTVHTMTCGGIASLRCPSYASCNYLVKTKDDCTISDVGGTCWALPALCPIPAVGFGPRHRACSPAGGACAEECPLIRREETWYMNGNCPL